MATLSHAEIKMIKSLSSKKFRDEFGLFAVEGEKMVAEALRSSFRVERVISRDEVGETVMARISSLATPPPVLALLHRPDDLFAERIPRPEKGLYLALDSIRDPGNLGTILRIADWFGLRGVFASPDTVDVFNPKVVQSTMGAIFRVPFHYTDIPACCRAFREAGGVAYGTFLDGKNLYGMPLACGQDSPVLLITGNESEGISPAVAAEVTERLTIPPFPAGGSGSESLNAAVATAVAVAEFRRRLLSDPL